MLLKATNNRYVWDCFGGMFSLWVSRQGRRKALAQFNEGTGIGNGLAWLWKKLMILVSKLCLFMVYEQKTYLMLGQNNGQNYFGGHFSH
jgi:hypothetical protein